jgi:hypothetical protein
MPQELALDALQLKLILYQFNAFPLILEHLPIGAQVRFRRE